jgi:hypothetical protein
MWFAGAGRLKFALPFPPGIFDRSSSGLNHAVYCKCNLLAGRNQESA